MIHKRRVASSFSAKSHLYNANASVQKQVLNRLLGSISKEDIRGKWLNIGSGPTDIFKLDFANNIELSINFDIAENSLINNSKTIAVCGDMDYLPFNPNQFDGIISSSVVQWSSNLEYLITGFNRIAKSGALIALTIFTEGTLRALHKTQEELLLDTPTNYISINSLDNIINCLPISIIKKDSTSIIDSFSSSIDALKSITSIGTGNVSQNKLSIKEFRKFLTLYTNNCKNGKNFENLYNVTTLILRKD